MTQDALVGLFFSAPLYEGFKDSGGWRGKVLDRSGNGDYLVEVYSWSDGRVVRQKLVDPVEVREWAFFPSAIALEASNGCTEGGSGLMPEYCGAEPSVLIEIEGLATLLRCERCAKFYGGRHRPLIAADFERPKPSLRDARQSVVEELAEDLRLATADTNLDRVERWVLAVRDSKQLSARNKSVAFALSVAEENADIATVELLARWSKYSDRTARKAVNELEEAGFVQRRSHGRITANYRTTDTKEFS